MRPTNDADSLFAGVSLPPKEKRHSILRDRSLGLTLTPSCDVGQCSTYMRVSRLGYGFRNDARSVEAIAPKCGALVFPPES